MKVPLVDLKRQYLLIKEEIDKSISKVLKSGWFIQGKETRAFEQEFASYCETRYCCSMSSGTDALYISLLALEIGRGDEVILPANSYIATALAVSLTGATPVLVDIDEDTYNINPALIERSVNKKSKVVIPIHLYGQTAAMEDILEIARHYNLYVIEDASQAHGALHKNKKAGSMGDMAVFSFYPTKNLNAYGNGGAILTSNKRLIEKVRRLGHYGSNEKQYYRYKGLNSNLEELQAAILRVKLKYLDKFNKQRRRNAHVCTELLANLPVKTPIEADDNKHIYHLYVIRTSKRNKLHQYLATKGITTKIHYPIPIHLQPAYNELRYKQGDFPVTEKCTSEILSLPLFPELRKEEIEYVAKQIRQFYL